MKKITVDEYLNIPDWKLREMQKRRYDCFDDVLMDIVDMHRDEFTDNEMFWILTSSPISEEFTGCKTVDDFKEMVKALKEIG